MNNPMWKTHDGRLLSPLQMETSHLENALKMCDRLVARRLMNTALSAIVYADTAPDGAAMAAEDAANECFAIMYDKEQLRKEGCRLSPVIRMMNDELRSRKS